MSLFLVPMAPSRRRLAAIVLALFGLIAVAIMVARDPISMMRWTQAAAGNVAGREVTPWACGIDVRGTADPRVGASRVSL